MKTSILFKKVARTRKTNSKREENGTLRTNSVAKGLNLSVLMFGFDSMSRMAWMRFLPKSREYFLSQLGGFELKGYNIVGDGTPAALFPILTGLGEDEIPEVRRGFKGAQPLDDLPWIWK